MKYAIVRTKRFKTAYKRVAQLMGFKHEVFEQVIATLSSGEQLEKKFKDHPLVGNMKEFRECHLAPDILLIYQIDDGALVLVLVSVGNHAQLFR